MHEPCHECANRRGFAYTRDCDDTCAYASAVKCRDEHIVELEKKLQESERATALMILKEFSRDMYPNYDLFGNKTLVINRDKFEAIRKKYLDRKD